MNGRSIAEHSAISCSHANILWSATNTQEATDKIAVAPMTG